MMCWKTAVALVCIITSVSLGNDTAATRPDPRRNPSLPVSSRTRLSLQVEDSIVRAVRYLLARQNADGSWGDVKDSPDHRVGETALVTLALLNCGEAHQSKELLKATTFLKKTKSVGPHSTYAVALRACVWASLPEAARGTSLRTDLTWLLGNTIKGGPTDGMYSYAGYPRGGDFSNSQYGVLGVWYAANAGLEVPEAYWKRVEKVWRKHQKEDGGWPYQPGRGPSYASMTAAGAATLYITNDHLHAADAMDLNVPATNRPIEKSIEWLGRHFAVDHNAGRDSPIAEPPANGAAGVMEDDNGGTDEQDNGDPTDRGDGLPRDDVLDGLIRRLGGENGRGGGWFVHYMLFSFERVGEASGLTRFGEHRWFDEGAEFLIRTQSYDGSWFGSWNTETSTAYALLFLSRGRAPVAIQKLQFGKRWNNRPRDAANFVRFLRFAAERHVNWQIVDVDAPLGDLREAPMLYLASDRPIQLTPEQREKIAAYVNEGGLLLLVNEGPGDAFARSAVAMCSELWPAYSFKDLPADHPVLENNFPTKGFPDKIQALSNGVRELALLLPAGDTSWKWQAAGGATTVNLSPYAPLANLWLHLTNKSPPRFKGETTWIERGENVAPAPRAVHVARLKHSGNWDPEPLGWQRLSNLLHNAQDANLALHRVEIDAKQLKASHQLAHLTATGTFDLTAAQRAVLKSYLDSGGLVLFDAAGGSTEAFVSFQAMMASIYPQVKSTPLPIDHPIYRGDFPGGGASRAVENVTYRRAAPGALPPTKVPRLRGYSVNGRVVAIESAEDLTAGLVGYSTGGITGYAPANASELVRNTLLWRASREVKPDS
jgi:hypothetical protein